MRSLLVYVLLVVSQACMAQDTAYARQVIRFLTSKTCFGRGYIKNGLGKAADYISAELKKNGAQPLFGSSYYQPFHFDVNTFPGKMEVTIDHRRLEPGVDFIVDPGSGSYKGTVTLYKKDSVSYVSQSKDPVSVQLKRKLTFSVASEAGSCKIQLLNNRPYGESFVASINIQNQLKQSFVSNNMAAFFSGTKNNDSMIVFSAHYDHLGGMGKKTFFPGANDNASGVSMVLNLMKYYSTHPPLYKTVFVFFAGEEAGLLGSRYFVQSCLKDNTVDLHRIKFLVNLDLLGTGDDGIMVVNGAVLQKEFEKLQQINDQQHLVKAIKKRGKASNSDHYWFYEAGVPCFFIYTLGGVTAYHDVYDRAATLPLTDYADVFRLITAFVTQL